MKLEPGEEELIVLKRTDRSGSFECNIVCFFTYPENVAREQIMAKGKKSQMKWRGQAVEVYSWVFEH